MDLITIVTITVTIAHLGVLLYGLSRQRLRHAEAGWFIGTVLLSLGACAVYLLPDDLLVAGKLGRGFFATIVLVAMIGVYGGLVIEDMISESTQRRRLFTIWGATAGLWLIALVVSALISPEVSLGHAGWLLRTFSSPELPSLIALVGLAISGVVLLGIIFYLFYEAVLPEIANRALYWVLNTSLLYMGVILLGSGTEGMVALGMVVLALAMFGTVYPHTSYRVIDIRGSMSRSLTAMLMTAVSGALIFMALYAVTGLNLNQDPEGFVLIAVLAVMITIAYIPLRQLAETFMRRLIDPPPVDPARLTREFSQQVSQAVELSGLAQVATNTLNRVMGVRRSGLMLVNSTDDEYMDLLVIPGGSFSPEMKGVSVSIPVSSGLYKKLAADHRPVTQFDIEYSPDFADLEERKRKFFTDLHMNAYAPIVVDNVMIGAAVCGPKVTDTAYTHQELELLTTLAQQIGFALRNARLVDDLKHLNSSMRSLNQGLEEANKELGRLDSVKSDFVTIASHELRTPLAQIRGYTDIIDALNEQGMLNAEQTTGLVANLRKATERMEELISAMLDVSQLDVNAMDLRFARTSPETVLRMAIEPLTDAIKQRKLTLSARGLRGLPQIHADLQRLVQAFRNIVVNAIKFTPDGGRIEITASLQEAQDENDVDHVLITIADTGVGIDKANLELVFKKFFRTYDPSLHSTGTYKFLGAGPGLGLTIAKGVIEGHAGKIWAESPGHSMTEFPGTTFYVLLPVNPPETARRILTFETNMTRPVPLPKELTESKKVTDTLPAIKTP